MGIKIENQIKTRELIYLILISLSLSLCVCACVCVIHFDSYTYVMQPLSMYHKSIKISNIAFPNAKNYVVLTDINMYKNNLLKN